MGFFAPWFLAGLAALGLPVWLHLLQQHKTTPKQFSSLMFFEKRTQSSIKHRRLKYLLLMAARLLLLLFLILAFAAPYIKRSGLFVPGSRKLLVIAVDNSYSMRIGDRLARAKREAVDVLSKRNGSQQAQVLTAGATIHAMTPQTSEANELRAAVEAIQPSDSRSSYGELARALRGLEQTAQIPLEVHFFSDLQKSSLPPAFIDLRLGDSTKLVVHPMAEKTDANYAVESVTAPRSVFDPKKARVQAVLVGYHAPKAKRTVTLSVNQKQVGSKVVDIPENGRATVEFVGLEANYGSNRADLKIDSGDVLPGDDMFSFSFERSDPRRVLFVHESGKTKGALYYRTALESSNEGAFLIDPIANDAAGNIAPSNYALVVISDVGGLPTSFEEALRNYVKGGGALLIAAGASSASKQKVPIFDEAIRETRYASRGGERFLVTGSMDATHPVLRATGRWENVKFYQAAKVEPGQSRVLARLSDDTPLLLEKRIGEGRALLFTSTFDNVSNDFPLHASFVPFIEQTARYLIGTEVRPSSYTVDSSVELRVEKGAGTVEVMDPKGKRALDLKESSTARSFLLTEAGYYDIGRANGRHELVAVNADRKESDLELMPQETLSAWQGTGVKPEQVAGQEREQQQTSNLWWYVMLAALLFALIESLLASQHLEVEPTDA